MTELFMALGIFGSLAFVLCVAVSLVYVCGGEKVRKQIRSEW